MKIIILGAGQVGGTLAVSLAGEDNDITIVDTNPKKLRALQDQLDLRTVVGYGSHPQILRQAGCEDADLVIGGVLIPGAAAPKLVTEQHIKNMKPGAAIVDVAIDQGGCIATSKATTHADPTYIVDDVVHYCVANMPGAVPRTSTFALNNATLPYILNLANKGYKQALLDDKHLLNGLNVIDGKVTCQSVAVNLGYEYVAPAVALA